MRFETMAVHAGRGRVREGGTDPQTTGEKGHPHVPLIDLSTTYGFDTAAAVAESMDRLVAGEAGAPNPIYSRLQNPTVEGFERALAALEGAEAAVAFGSGMAAITAVLMAVGSDEAPEGWARGRHVVAIRPIYGGTDHLLSSGMLGHEVTWARPDEVGGAIREDTALVILETPANPTLDMVDIAGVVAQVRAREAAYGHRIAVAVDNTFATPVLQRPLELGADIVIHSATKFLGGHGDVMGGVVATSEAWARPVRRVRTATGGVLHPLAAYMLHRGLQTLPIRVEAQQKVAEELVRRLAAHPDVLEVHYPGHSGDPTELRLLETQQKGPGSMLAFRIRGGAEAARVFMESLRLITRAVSLGSVDTLIQAPALLTHRVVDEDARHEAGIPDDLLRVSVGLESPDDLWADMEQALEMARRAVAPGREEAASGAAAAGDVEEAALTV